MPLVRLNLTKAAGPPIPGVLEARLIAAAVKALSRIGWAIDEAWLAAVVAAKDMAAIKSIANMDVLAKALAPIKALLAEQIALSATAEAVQLKIVTTFASVDALVVEAADELAAKLITNIADATRKTIHDLIVHAWASQSLTVKDVAKILRSTIGLTAKQAIAIHGAYAAAYVAAIAAGKSPAAAEALADKLIEKLRKRAISVRATTIARTEIMTAANAGRYLSWQDANTQSLVRTGTLKEWVTAPHESSHGAPCPICLPLDGRMIPWEGDWPTGAKMPPAHPRCRCTAVMRKPGTEHQPPGS